MGEYLLDNNIFLSSHRLAPIEAPAMRPDAGDGQGGAGGLFQGTAGVPLASVGVPAPGPGASADAKMAMGLAAISDWSTQQPFIDIMKSARPWVGHLAGRWGGWGHDELAAGGFLDPKGWLRKLPDGLSGISTIVLADQPEDAVSLAGRYHLTYQGEGEMRIEGRGRVVLRRPGEIVFDFVPGEGHVLITITSTDPRQTGDHIRDIAIVKESNLALHAAGAVFNPDWIERIHGLDSVRFMDWMQTNNSTISDWSERPEPGDYTYALRGAPLEVMVDLANLLGADPWFNMPHRGDDAFVMAFAEQVRDRLAPGLRAYVEYSNEIWNWQFEQAHWARAEAEARWGAAAPGDAWMQFAGMRAAQVAKIWDAAFAEEAEERLVNVLSTQTAWLGLEAALLEAPLWVAENPTLNRAPATRFDAYGIAGYFGASLGAETLAAEVRGWIATSRAAADAAATAQGLTGAPRAAFLAAHEFDAAVGVAAAELRDGSVSGGREGSLAHLACDLLPYQAEAARAHGLDLVMYEGGTHVVAQGNQAENADLSAFFTHLNYTPEMAELYRLLRGAWADVGGTLFNAYLDVAAPGVWGSWGTLRHLDDANPRWDALFTDAASGPVCSSGRVRTAGQGPDSPLEPQSPGCPDPSLVDTPEVRRAFTVTVGTVGAC